MGHGASALPQEMLATVFGMGELQAGSAAFLENPKLRNAFLNYVKGGLWVDRIGESTLFLKMAISHEERLAREKQNIVYEYKMPHGKAESICPFFIKTVETSVKQNTTSISNSNSMSYSDRISECYVNIEQCDCFTAPQLISILFSVVHPMYLASKQYQQFLRTGNDREAEEDSAGDPNSGNKNSRRAQEILLGTAAYFDESLLLEQLERGQWATILGQTFDGHKLAITVSDCSKEGNPLVYVNHAFEAMSGRQRSFLAGKGLDVLNGAETEPAMLDHVQEALRTSQALKVAVTHYTTMGRSFTNLMAMRPHKTYMMAVHVVANKHARLADLQQVDDLLTLMAYLVRPPAPAPAPLKKGLSGWIAGSAVSTKTGTGTATATTQPSSPMPNSNAQTRAFPFTTQIRDQ